MQMKNATTRGHSTKCCEVGKKYFIFYLLPLARLKKNGRKNATEWNDRIESGINNGKNHFFSCTYQQCPHLSQRSAELMI